MKSFDPFVRSNQHFFHAINLADFLAYWDLQGLLSRKCLEEKCPEITRFFSDKKDLELGVWGRVFGNLSDLGRFFWSRNSATPNACGPITLVYSEGIWSELPDLRITRKSITADDPGEIPAGKWGEMFEVVNGKPSLKREFRNCELSSETDLVSFKSLAYIRVDPIAINDVTLRDLIRSRAKVSSDTFNLSDARLIERSYMDDQKRYLFSQLIEWS